MRVPRKNPEINDAIELLQYHLIEANGVPSAAWTLLTADEREWVDTEIERALDLRYYLENYHFITTENGVLKALYPFWDHQEIVYEAVQQEWAENGYCKLIILKPRQLGMSTWTAAAMFHRTIMTPHCFTMLIGQNDRTSEHIYKMSLKAYDNLPWWLRPEYIYKTKSGAIEFQRADERERMMDPGLGSAIQVSPATQVSGIAIGRSVRCLHMSEASRYPSDEIWEADIKPSMNASDTFAIVESTGFGRQGLFYEMWGAAEDGDNDFRPIFLPIYKVRKYFLPIKGEFKLTSEEETFNERVLKEQHYQIPDEFWNFRRRGMRAAKRGGNKAGFLESYPLTPAEAFQSSGLCAFDRDSLEFQSLNCAVKPLWAGEISLISVEPPRFNTDGIEKIEPDFILPKRKSGRGGYRLHVWEMPEKGETYEESVDVALGNGGDYTVIQVWRAGSGREPDTQVAEWWGWIPPRRAAHVAAAIGLWYNAAEIAVEYMKDGVTTGNELRDLEYPNLYRPQKRDRIANQATNYLHWETNSKTRDEIIGCMNEALLDKTVVIRSEDLLDEMTDFAAMDIGGKVEGQGNNDDGCMSAMIGLFTLREATRHMKGVSDDVRRSQDDTPYIWGVYDNFMRQRGQYNTKAQAEKVMDGRPGWKVAPVMIMQANTIFSPIFDRVGPEHDLHYRHGVPSDQITPDLVYAYKSAMGNFGAQTEEFGEDW